MRFGIDLGGTKTEIVALDADDRECLRRRVPTPAHDYDAVVATIAALVADAERELGIRGSVGVATPGAPSRATGRMKNANSTVLNDRDLAGDLSRAVRRPVRIANDANCFALSEASDGAANDAACVFGVILGTGVGGALVVDGRIVTGRNGIAGEWGHNPLPWPSDDERPGPTCYCGKFGCVETFVSGPGFASDHRLRTGETLESRAIVAAARDGEENARATLARYIDRLARSLASVVNVVDPDTIVLGGGMSNARPVLDDVRAAMRAYVFSDTFETAIVRARHGDSSGVRGAARLWDAREAPPAPIRSAPHG